MNAEHIKNTKTIYHSETRVFNEIKTKLIDHNAIITKADKGQTLVILTYDDYKNKILDLSLIHI